VAKKKKRKERKLQKVKRMLFSSFWLGKCDISILSNYFTLPLLVLSVTQDVNEYILQGWSPQRIPR
jgi:hypothetical protein